MVRLCETLVANGHAYVAEDHVLFDVSARCPTTDGWPTARWRRWKPARAWTWRPTRKAPWTSCCGSRRSPASRLAVAGGHRGAGPARLAHRVLGDGGEASGPGVRHSRRRHRPRVPPPRERDRAVALRARHAGDGQLLDAQRLPAGRGREDVQEPGEFRDDQGVAETTSLAAVARRCLRLQCCARTIGSPSTGRNGDCWKSLQCSDLGAWH